MQRPLGNPTDRWQRILSFDENVLSEIHRDSGATLLGLLTVFAAMAASGLGGFLWWVVEGNRGKLDFFLESTIMGTLIATGLFFVWAGLVGASAGQLGRQEVLAATVRTISYASFPFAVSFFIFIPGLEYPITLLAVALLVISTTLATRVSLGLSFGRALGSNLIGFFLWALILTQLMEPGGYFAPAIFVWGAFA